MSSNIMNVAIICDDEEEVPVLTPPCHDQTINDPISSIPVGVESGRQEDNSIQLPTLLQILFGLNGVTLSLPTLSLMYIINTRVQIPLAYLPTYGAIAFLPYSLKPIYAYLSSCDRRNNSNYNNNSYLLFCRRILQRQNLLPILFAANSISIFLLTLIRPGDIVGVFVLGFVRGITDSWAELCLGLTLIDHAQQNSLQQRYDVLASRFQAQAATARNAGSILGASITCLLFIQRQIHNPDDTQLSGPVADVLLIVTALFQLAGAIVVCCNNGLFRSSTTTRRHHSRRSLPMTSFRLLQQTEENEDELFVCLDETNATQQQQLSSHSIIHHSARIDEESALNDDDGNHSPPSYSSHSDDNDDDNIGTSNFDDHFSSPTRSERRRNDVYSRTTNMILIVILQLVIILFAMKNPFQEWTSSSSPAAWNILLSTLLVAILILSWVLYRNRWWRKTHRVGLFLVLRHAIPSASMILYSFYYSLFQSSPLLLQILSVLSQGVTTLSSWSYGKLLSGYSSGRSFLVLVGATTVLTALASLGNLALIGKSPSSNSQMNLFWIAASIRLLTSFFSEWAFLPDVVIATTSLVDNPEEESGDEQPRHPSVVETRTIVVEGDRLSNNNDDNIYDDDDSSDDDSSRIAIKYGTMISCIDFGDQLGSMLAGPLVVLLGISRENNFLHLDRLIVICSILSILSLPLILLIRKKGDP